MELLKSLFIHMFDINHRVGRKKFFLTYLLYSFMVFLVCFTLSFVAVLLGGEALMTLIAVVAAAPITMYMFSLIIGFPLYSLTYHRILDTGQSKRFSLIWVSISFAMQIVLITLSHIVSYVPGSFDGTIMSPAHVMLNTALAFQAIYGLITIVLILSRSKEQA